MFIRNVEMMLSEHENAWWARATEHCSFLKNVVNPCIVLQMYPGLGGAWPGKAFVFTCIFGASAFMRVWIPTVDISELEHLEIIVSDVCGKVDEQGSIGALKHKSEVGWW